MASTSRQEKELQDKIKRTLQGDTSKIDPVELLRMKCLERGANGVKSFGRVFRIMDDDNSNSLNFEEFSKGLLDNGVNVDAQKAKAAFQAIDKDNSGTISFDEFLVKLRGPMSASRVRVIEQAFNKLDRTGDGKVTVEDFKGVYHARKHPKYMNGEWTEQQVFSDYLKKFDSPDDPDGEITKEEFQNYYAGVSASIDDDTYFDLMMRNAWKL